MARKRKKPKQITGANSKYAKPYNPNAYRINTRGLRGRLRGKRILADLTADPDQYRDNREPVYPGPTIPKPLRAYPWEGTKR
ncbi:hypothetical protein QN224_24835 [Sinorhizobium sp. 8-89]|uniref:hypothetical protein n=1 Tax=Sinorhizobium sp. 7-81 TaxID=3049087 RepID=UPI0024C20F56|nr:hypothetical protein [Sinorhizobium sp. 7-81]MDK1388639.1 hypothetical protein [Sinorhizobium sp. 7-81]